MQRAEVRRTADLERGDHVELAGVARQRLGDVVFSEGQLYRYAAPCWSTVEPGLIEKIAQGFAGSAVNRGKKTQPLDMRSSDVSGVSKETQRMVTDSSFFAAAPRGVTFGSEFVSVLANGAVLVEPTSRESRQRWALPHAFEPNAAPTLLLKALREMFEPPLCDAAALPEIQEDARLKIQLIQEFFGACLAGMPTRYQRYLVLLGDGANGKSTVAELLTSIFPPGSTSAIPIQDFGQEYRAAMLAGKLLNVVGELPERDILASEALKAIVAGDEITGRHIRQDPFKFKPRAGHVFNAQKMPMVNDFSHGFWRRPLIVGFDVKFSDEPAAGERLKDAMILDALYQESGAIASWLIAGAARLAARGKFEEPLSSRAAVSKWQRDSDAVGMFADHFFRESGLGDDFEVYRLYQDWCLRTGHKPCSMHKLIPRLREMAPPGRAEPIKASF